MKTMAGFLLVTPAATITFPGHHQPRNKGHFPAKSKQTHRSTSERQPPRFLHPGKTPSLKVLTLKYCPKVLYHDIYIVLLNADID